MSEKKRVEVFCDLLAETEKAICIDDGSGDETWLPKSTVRYDDSFTELMQGTIEVDEWIALDKGLI